MSKLYYISQDYKPKGAIEGYPLKVIDRMIHEQVKQGNEADVTVFEYMSYATKPEGGFNWHMTDYEEMWKGIYQNRDFDYFFDTYENEHITPEEYDEVNGLTLDLFDEKNTLITKLNDCRQQRLKYNRFEKSLKKHSIFFDNGEPLFNDKFSGKGMSASEAANKAEEMKKEAEKSLKKAEKKENEVREKSKDYIKDAFESIPEDAKERVENYDFINPEHYKSGSKEVWEMMLDIWGPEKFIAHCEMCAFKYRMRLGKKPNQPIERDLDKAKWYEDKVKELKTNKT